jgi:hypothetical protein
VDLAAWRDISLVIIGVLYTLITLVVGVIFFVVWRYSRGGFRALDRLLTQKVRPALDQVELQLLALRERTAALPGNAALGAGQGPPRRRRGGLLALLPFRRKRRRFPLLPS